MLGCVRHIREEIGRHSSSENRNMSASLSLFLANSVTARERGNGVRDSVQCGAGGRIWCVFIQLRVILNNMCVL